MGKLHKKMVALGDMTQYSYDDIVASCGEPKEKHACSFSDIGEGTRATWSDGIFSITFNFNSEGKYCGIYDHKNWSPYIWLGVVTAILLAAAFLWGAYMRAQNAETVDRAASVAETLLSTEADWRTDVTAGASLCDLDFDGTPELLAVDTEFTDLDGSVYFGDTDVRVFRLTDGGVSPAGGFTVPDYCFLAELVLYESGDGSVWCFADGDAIRAISLADGSFSAGDGTALSADGDKTFPLLPNECWVTADGAKADDAAVQADLSAVAAGYFA